MQSVFTQSGRDASHRLRREASNLWSIADRRSRRFAAMVGGSIPRGFLPVSSELAVMASRLPWASTQVLLSHDQPIRTEIPSPPPPEIVHTLSLGSSLVLRVPAIASWDEINQLLAVSSIGIRSLAASRKPRLSDH